jgi:diguanylate cyclase (GGDEF)-like protein/PAS domain S-box-containing protein
VISLRSCAVSGAALLAAPVAAQQSQSAILAAPASSRTAPRALSIADARRSLDSDEIVRVAGRATVGSGVLQRRAFDIAIEDDSAGLRLFSFSPQPEVAEGDSVEAVGVVRSYRGTLELVLSTVRVVPAARRVPAPVLLGSRPVDQRDAARLLHLRGHVLSAGTSEGGRFARLATAIDTVTLWAPAPHAAPPDVDGLRVGDHLAVTGIVAAYQDGPEQPLVWQIIPRGPEDVRVEGVPRRWYERAEIALAVALAGGLLVWLLVRAATRGHLRELQETEARYRQLLELSPEAVFVHDGNTLLFANPAAARLLGAAHERTLEGRPLAWFAPPGQVEAFGRPDAPGARARIRFGGNGAGGVPADVELTASPCRYHDRPAVVVLAHDVSAQLRHERELQALALLDDLTGLANRRGFSTFAEQELKRARETGRGAVVLVADLVGLKRINDEHGHAAGDEAIRVVARALRAVAGEASVLARWGGDEFVALLFDGDDRNAADTLTERLHELVRDESPSGLPYVIRATVGAAALGPDDDTTVADGIAQADQNLYRARSTTEAR